MSIPLLFVNTLSNVGCAFFPKPSVNEPLSTGHGNLPLFPSKLLLKAAVSLVSTVTLITLSGAVSGLVAVEVVEAVPPALFFLASAASAFLRFASAAAISL